MQPSNSARSTKRFLITSPDPQTVAEVTRIIEADPNVKLVDRIGPENQPHTLVVEMTDEQADALKRRFAGLIVEQDRPVSLFDSEPPRGSGKSAKPGRQEPASARQPLIRKTETQPSI